MSLVTIRFNTLTSVLKHLCILFVLLVEPIEGRCHAPQRLHAHDCPTSHTGPIPVMTVMRWCQINTKISYLQHMSRDLQEGCQWLTDGILTGAHPLFTCIPVPYHVSCPSCI